VDFEIEDALGKLVRTGVVERRGSRFRARPIESALDRLDDVWDHYSDPAWPEAVPDDPDEMAERARVSAPEGRQSFARGASPG
jgi:hypothetical protein